jgi:hypothetical protein
MIENKITYFKGKGEHSVHELEKICENDLFLLYERQIQIQRLRDALKELTNEASDLMDFCIDRGHLDNEDLTDGQKLFELALNNAINLLKEI